MKCNFYVKADVIELQKLTDNKMLLECIKRKINLLKRNTKSRIWTFEDYKFMVDNWGKMSKFEIAQKLNRSLQAVNIKASRIGLKRYFVYSDYISLNELHKVIYRRSLDSYTLAIWEKYDFPIRKVITKENPVMAVKTDEFLDWFKTHKRLIDLSKTQEGCFGINEPDWLKEKRIADKKSIPYQKHNVRWTQNEDKTLIEMVKSQKYGYREISVAIKRTEGAIKRRMLDLKLSQRPIKADNHNKWSESEIATVKDLWLKGYQTCVIAEEINRSDREIISFLERNKYYGMPPQKFNTPERGKV